MSTRLALLNRREHSTQKVKIAAQRTLYIAIHNDERPAEIFLRVKGPDMSLALQYGDFT